MLDVLHRAWTSEGEFRFVLRFVIGWIKYICNRVEDHKLPEQLSSRHGQMPSGSWLLEIHASSLLLHCTRTRELHDLMKSSNVA